MNNKNKIQDRYKKAKGSDSEQLACTYLQEHGLTLVEQNFSSRYGEVDIIMRESDTLVFVEVRYRKNNHFGGAAASVTPAKQQKIIKTALSYQQRHAPNDGIRFDIFAIEGDSTKVEWLKNAFDGF